LIAQPFGILPKPLRLRPRGPVQGLVQGAIILELGGRVEIIPGNEPRPPLVIDERNGKISGLEEID
jgi:hypothetical protein